MRIEIEQQDIEAIAKKVVELIIPLVPNTRKQNTNDVVFDVNELAEYLRVDSSWVYKQVSLNAIPYFKAGKYPRFKKKDIDRWIESQTAKPVPPLRLERNKEATC